MASSSTTTTTAPASTEDKKKPTKRHSIYQYDAELALGFQTDCEDFLQKFQSLKTCRFDEFSKLWREMRLTSIFEDQTYITMLRTFTENCYVIVKKFLINSPDFHINVGAFYLLYAIHAKQPVRNWIKIRLVKMEYEKIRNLIATACASYDPARTHLQYVLAQMLASRAFEFVAEMLPNGPEEKYAKRYNLFAANFVRRDTAEAVDQFRRFYETDEVLARLMETTREYEQLKGQCLDVECRGLPRFESNVLKTLKDTYEDLLK